MLKKKTKRLYLKAYITNKDQYFYAHCIDLDLMARGDSKEEARDKLHEQICSYLDYINEKDPDGELLPRRAPFIYYLKFYFLLFLCEILHRKTVAREQYCHNKRTINENVELAIAC